MMKKILTLTIVLFLFQNLRAQRIFEVKAEYNADFNIFVVDRDYKADLLVFKVDRDYKAKDNAGLWYFTDLEYNADVKVFFVDRDYKSDLKIFFVDRDYRAGWRNEKIRSKLSIPIKG
ncbi:DUF6150 family protein [Muricauda sp. MAR_2010_75]|jgi:lipocalin|uniref:DUF6150 family protein n=1 Tax=Allomuricauda sp. MAR_2010_75 TaxID=1250232 RepID=UPI000A412AA6|nr:DUF6150 family protein [Muricauda sp. MAR_2010_75]